MSLDFSKFRRWLRRILLVLNILVGLGLWLCCLSTRFEPYDWPMFSLLGLAFPVFLLADILFTIPWLIVNYRRAWVPWAILLPCLGYALDYCPISLNSQAPEDCIKILSWNTGNFGSHYQAAEGEEKTGKDLTTEYIRNSNADIICLQESGIWDAAITEFTNDMDSLGYHNDRYLGCYLYTRFPILESDTLRYDTHTENGVRGNGSKWYKLLVGKDTILLVNNHLESNRLREEVKNQYVETLDKPDYVQIKKSGRTIGSQLMYSTSLRGHQADSLVMLAKRFKNLPIIMCGDFNDTPISYTYQRVNRILKSAFRESGNGIGISFNERGFWVRIDHLFISRHWKSYNTQIDNSINASDHYPLVSWLKME